MKRQTKTNLGLLAVVVLLAVGPLALGAGDHRKDPFTGSDSQGQTAINQLEPAYKPWFAPLFRPPSKEVESALFALQAAIGAGVLAYCVGLRRGRRQGAARASAALRADAVDAAAVDPVAVDAAAVDPAAEGESGPVRSGQADGCGQASVHSQAAPEAASGAGSWATDSGTGDRGAASGAGPRGAGGGASAAGREAGPDSLARGAREA